MTEEKKARLHKLFIAYGILNYDQGFDHGFNRKCCTSDEMLSTIEEFCELLYGNTEVSHD